MELFSPASDCHFVIPSNPDVRYFEWLAPLFDLVHPGADADELAAGLALADRDVERVIDVGGGTGRAVRAIRADERAVVDAARSMLARAHRYGLGAIRGDATRLPVASESVDAVLVVDALHHFPDARATIREVARVLRPGGVVVLREFDPSTLRGRAVVGFEHLVGFDSAFFAPDELTTVLTDAGLAAMAPERGFEYTAVGKKPRE
jgi:demethylmenaquinone methyltransferase/2-methoxy-6-polyprenyl-1,4-benzoquinol methylase